MKSTIFTKSLLGLSVCALLLTSCEKDNEDLDPVVDQKSELVKAKAYAEEIGYHPDDIEIKDFLLPDGSTEERIYVEGRYRADCGRFLRSGEHELHCKAVPYQQSGYR